MTKQRTIRVDCPVEAGPGSTMVLPHQGKLKPTRMAGLEIRFLLASLADIIHRGGRLGLLGDLRVVVASWAVTAGTGRIRRQCSSF